MLEFFKLNRKIYEKNRCLNIYVYIFYRCIKKYYFLKSEVNGSKKFIFFKIFLKVYIKFVYMFYLRIY